MKIKRSIHSSAAALGLTFIATSSFAQGVAVPAVEAKAEVKADAAAPAAPAPAAAAPAAPVAEPAAAAEPEPEAVAAAEPEPEAEEPTAEPAAAAEPEPEAEEPTAEPAAAAPAEEESTGTPALFVFADAWAGWQSAKSGDPAGGGVYDAVGPAGTAESGFGLNWLGADMSYDGGEWGVTGNLRFGDAVAQYGTGTLGPITQAYATWRPTEGLALDLGAFQTIYGAEVADSWKNLNYSRGELYFNMQPFWHTGLRAEYKTGNWVARGLLVNEPNSSNLGAGALNAGAQVGYVAEKFALYGGALQSLKPETSVANTLGFKVDTFIDVIATATLGDLSLIGNFDMNVGYEAAAFWGASVMAGYQFVPAFGVALRGEYLSTPDGFLYGVAADGDESLMTGTVTLSVKPVPGVDNFLVRWDNRVEMASEEVYVNTDASDNTDTWFSSTIGVVAYADLL